MTGAGRSASSRALLRTAQLALCTSLDFDLAGSALLRRLDPTNLRVRKSLRCPPSRRVPDKWSGRRPNKNMGRGSGLSGTKREGVSEQRGWAPKALRLASQAPKALRRDVWPRRGVSW
jgi:hypothetical protein